MVASADYVAIPSFLRYFIAFNFLHSPRGLTRSNCRVNANIRRAEGKEELSLVILVVVPAAASYLRIINLYETHPTSILGHSTLALALPDHPTSVPSTRTPSRVLPFSDAPSLCEDIHFLGGQTSVTRFSENADRYLWTGEDEKDEGIAFSRLLPPYLRPPTPQPTTSKRYTFSSLL